MKPTFCSQHCGFRREQAFRPLKLVLAKNGTQKERKALQLAPNENRYHDQKRIAPAHGKAGERRNRVGNPRLTGCSPTRLDDVAERKNGADSMVVYTVVYGRDCGV